MPALLGGRTIVVSPRVPPLTKSVTLPVSASECELPARTYCTCWHPSALGNRSGDTGHSCLAPRNRGKTTQSSHMKYDIFSL